MRNSDFQINKVLLCDAEKVTHKGDVFIGRDSESDLFKGGNLRTKLEAHSGEYSVLTIPKRSAYALAYEINQIEPNAYLEVSVWRKSKDGSGNLVVAAERVNDYYRAINEPTIIGEDGWERLDVDVYIPPNYGGGKLKIYVWNNGSDTVYFDDLKITRKVSKEYPDLDYQEGLNLVIDTSDFLKIEKKRIQAFTYGILQTTDNDWIKGIVVDSDIAKQAKMRLKGDWLDHLWGNKWSYRVKMRKQNTFNRLRTFSLQTPSARSYLLEWLTHKLYHYNDVLTTRYGFTPLSFNNQPRGLYVWEEHFVKQLPEWNNRREGPIVKFSEDSFWQIQKQNINHNKWPNFPYYYSCIIEPFSQSKVVSDPGLYSRFIDASKLMEQYKFQTKPAHEIFDVDKLAKYYAMLELTHARHGMTWHNQRMYFNPVICKLEPIAFDGYTDHEMSDFTINDNMAYKALKCESEMIPQDRLILNLFTDTIFLNRYMMYVEMYSDEKQIDEFTQSLSSDIVTYDSLLKLEFPKYHYDPDFLKKSAAGIRDYLPVLKQLIEDRLLQGEFKIEQKVEFYVDSSLYENTPEFFVTAYVEDTVSDKLVLSVNNYFLREITLLGSGIDEKFMTEFFDEIPVMKPFLSFKTNTVIEIDTSANSLFFSVDGSDEIFAIPLIPWAYPKGITPQQELWESINLSNPIFASVSGKNIFISDGKSIINEPLVIPPGYHVYFNKGTIIDLVDSAMIISYSPVTIKGTVSDPVVFTSSDFSGNGFTVLQAEEESSVANAVFENLNTLNYKSWTLTGALTFYESDVVIKDTKFYRNQCEDALNIIRSNFIVENSTFDYIFGDAFDADFCNGEILGCVFTNIGNDAMDFSGSDISIVDTEVNGANDKGISGGEDSRVVVTGTTILKANIGFASKDLSFVEVIDSRVESCNYGVVLLQKKPEYGPSILTLSNTQIIDSKTDMLIEQGSKVIMDNRTIVGEEKNLGLRFY